MPMRAGDNLPHPQDAPGCAVQQDPAVQPPTAGHTTRGLEVEWVVQPRHDGLTALFIESLANTYGKRIASTVKHELGLDNGTDTIPPDIAEQARRMAETQVDVFSGANFFVELHCSASARGPGFLKVCQRAGVAANSVTADDVDRRFRVILVQASQCNQMPLSIQDGERLLEAMLREDAAGGPGG